MSLEKKKKIEDNLVSFCLVRLNSENLEFLNECKILKELNNEPFNQKVLEIFGKFINLDCERQINISCFQLESIIKEINIYTLYGKNINKEIFLGIEKELNVWKCAEIRDMNKKIREDTDNKKNINNKEKNINNKDKKKCIIC